MEQTKQILKELVESISNYNKVEGIPEVEETGNEPAHQKRWFDAWDAAVKHLEE